MALAAASDLGLVFELEPIPDVTQINATSSDKGEG